MNYYLGIGSNYNAQENCKLMIENAVEEFQSVLLSSIIKTKDQRYQGESYLNAVICIDSKYSLSDLKAWCLSIEKKLGRNRHMPHICHADIDILLMKQLQAPYFQILVNQLTQFQKAIDMPFLSEEVVSIYFRKNQTVGLYPAYLNFII